LRTLVRADAAGWRQQLRPNDLDPLRPLLPEQLLDELAASDEPARLLLLPAGALWSVPWSALELDDGRLLGEAAQVVTCPSLSLQLRLAERARAERAQARLSAVAYWRHPEVVHHDLRAALQHLAAPGSLTEFDRPAEVIDALLSGAVGLFVVVAHGRPLPDGSHYVELAPGEVMTAAELLQEGVEPPERLALVACWGSSTGSERLSDPAAVATIALARGAREVLATTYELADSAFATMIVERCLATVTEHGSFAAALQATIASLFRSDPALRSELIGHWAPLQVIGTFPSHEPDQSRGRSG
jgi:CHAT domain-containing protein